MASAMDSRLAYARLSAVATASRLPTATRGSNNSYTTSWDTTLQVWVPDTRVPGFPEEARRQALAVAVSRHAEADQAFIDAISEIDAG